MERVLQELETVGKDPAPDPVHDLRVAIRRCRSVGAVFQEVDPDPAWTEMRRVPRKLFRRLGVLRDAQVMDDWVRHLAPDGDVLRPKLHTHFTENDAELRARGMAPIQARVALARNVCRLGYRLLGTQQPFDEQRYRRGRLSRGR